MPFRLGDKTIATFATMEEALDQARAIVRDDTDTQPEVLDVDTGQPVAPGANRGSRDLLASKIGF